MGRPDRATRARRALSTSPNPARGRSHETHRSACPSLCRALRYAARRDKPLFVYVSPNPIGVNDFLKLGKIGTERVAQALGGVAKTYESSDPTTQRQNLEAAAKAGAKVVVAIGFEFNDMLPEVATAYPNVKFLQVDSCPVRQDEAEHPLLGVSRI